MHILDSQVLFYILNHKNLCIYMSDYELIILNFNNSVNTIL